MTLHNVLIDNNVGTVSSGTITTNGTPLRGPAGYVNAGAGDYHLTAASGAVDKGNGLPPPVDLDGAVRPQGATTDIGAYEFAPLARCQQQEGVSADAGALIAHILAPENPAAAPHRLHRHLAGRGQPRVWPDGHPHEGVRATREVCSGCPKS